MVGNTEARLNREHFQILLGKKEWTAKEFHERWVIKYKIKMGYNNFMELLNNNVSWKLVYAFAISDMLEVDINELFDFTADENH